MMYIGIDLGTSACKLLLMDENGRIYNIVSKEYPLEFPKPGWSQQDPADWKKAVMEGIPELLQGFDTSQVAGVGAGGQMHGLVVLDENVNSAAGTKALGIETGDMVCFDPRTRRTESGYLKSRFLDDKLSVGILLGFARYLKDLGVKLSRHTSVYVTVYEEVGHGGSASIPADVTEAISVDMGCVGNGLSCTERQVSICAKDSGGPYNYEVVGKLIEAAKKENADYAVDVYPHYGSDVEATLRAGYDVRHGLIGAGSYASHGYERSHIEGVYNTLKVLCGYLKI